MDKKDLIPVGTKVSPEARARMLNICKTLGTSEYNILQMLYEVLILMMDDRHNLSYAMEQLIRVFDGVKDWNNSIRLTDSTANMKIIEAFYVMAEPGRKGVRLVYVQGEPGDMFRTESYNIQAMMERFICEAFPSMYRTLRAIGVELGMQSIYQTLQRIVDDYNTNPDAEELRDMFSDNDWSENAKKPSYNRAKSTRTNKQTELFGDE